MPAPHDFEFVKTELRTGLTFSTIALQAKDPQKISRNTMNARKAYDALLRFLDKSALSDQDLADVEQNLAKLKSNLIQLGETF